MADHPSPRITSRKQPRQARSTELVAAILDAAAQVLAREGATRFTTARVAEKAGVSIGSLYQYFPNKAAILFRLQHEEWRQTGALLQTILEAPATPPRDRLRALVHAFVRSECKEAAMRGALDDAAPFYRDAPEAKAARESGRGAMRAFLRDAVPGLPDDRLALAAELITTTLSRNGKLASEQARTPDEVERFAAELADMLCAYLVQLEA